jgi:hypothetical protein
VEHWWRGVGAPGNTSSEGRMLVGGVIVRWRNELGPAVLGGVGVAAVVGDDGEGSLQHRGVKGEENSGSKWKDTEWWQRSPERRKRWRWHGRIQHGSLSFGGRLGPEVGGEERRCAWPCRGGSDTG